jgi:transposase
MVEDYKNESWLREKYWDEGKSQSEIAHEIDIGITTVSRWMKKHNIETRSKSEGNSGKLRDEEWLRDQYKNQQKSMSEIADILGVDSSTVDRWMKKHGIETRSYSEAASTDGNIRKLRDEEWLREQYENREKSQVEIADELDVDESTVIRWMKKHGIETRSNSERQSEGDVGKLRDEEWLREQYENQQKTTYEIAEELNVSSNTVVRWMRKHGIQTRSNSERQSGGDVEKLRNEEWLREQYENQQKSPREIADKLEVSHSTVRNWLKRHGIDIRSSIIYPEHTTHIVRSEWELEICNTLVEMDVDYGYETLEIEYGDGSTYVPDFVTDEYVIEVKGAYFSEIHGYKNTGREKAMATIENLDERDYVVVGKELPADVHIPWEERSKIRELLSNV